MPTPEWAFVDNLGDASPLEHGGLFLYTDRTGVYPPEMERVEPSIGKRFEVRRVVLAPCTFVNGVLSDNPYHPDHPAWFATDLPGVASSMGCELDELRARFCSTEPRERASAWCDVLDYHGWENGDSYPLELTRKEAEARYVKGEL